MPVSRSSVTVVLGLAALFSGVALLVHILAGYSLRLALASTTGMMVVGVGAVRRDQIRPQPARPIALQPV